MLQLTMPQPQLTTMPQLQLMARDHTTKKDQPYTNTDMLSMTTTLKLTSKPTNTVTDMPPTVNTVSIFLMAVPNLLPTTSPMLTEDMLLMSNTKVLLNTQNTTQLSLL